MDICFCCKKREKKREIVLLLLGLDNAGKTTAAKTLARQSLDSVFPTIGFSIIKMNYGDFEVKIFDLGGGENIRGIWEKYFVDAHGVIFVVDSSDHDRLPIVGKALTELMTNEKVCGKPFLVLANKQDQRDAIDELDLVKTIKLEQLVNEMKCPTLVESCCARNVVRKKSKLDSGIKIGYRWLLNYIIRNYESLNSRVENDVRRQENDERISRELKLKKLKEENSKRLEHNNIYAIETCRDEIKSPDKNQQKTNLIVEVTPNSENIKNININKSGNSSCSSGSSISGDGSTSFILYHGIVNDQDENLNSQRPKSARQLVKEQLELGKPKKKTLNFLIRPKTAPIHFYPEKSEKLETAKESIFIISKSSLSLHHNNCNNEELLELKQSILVAKPKPTLILVNGVKKEEISTV